MMRANLLQVPLTKRLCKVTQWAKLTFGNLPKITYKKIGKLSIDVVTPIWSLKTIHL